MFRRGSVDKDWQESSFSETLEDSDELGKGTQDFFELLERLQNSRLDDQRCVLPSSLQLPVSFSGESSSFLSNQQTVSEVPRSDRELLQKVLKGSKPYPMVLLPPSGGYRLDAGENWTNPSLLNVPQNDTSLLEVDRNVLLYRKHFYNKEHFNFIMNDSNIGPIVMSIKYETSFGQEYLRVILRKRYDIINDVIPLTFETESLQATKIAKMLCNDICTDKYFAVLFPKATDLILAFDEHVLVNKMKFGIIYQKPGQITEEEMFGNEIHSLAMEEFLQLLGNKVELRGFKGFRGGLDTQDGLTGDHSYYTTFEDVEIMFHVSTLLPFSRTDPQQLQRKRHIGNDVVVIVFQDENTPFMPSMIASNFVHTFIVVQPVNLQAPNTSYKISVAFRDDVPFFGPALPNPPILSISEEWRRFLLTKLVNAEIASLKAKKFASLTRRTRDSLLRALHDTLFDRTIDFCGFSVPTSNNKTEILSGSSGFFDSVRKVLSGRSRSHSVESNIAHTTPKRSSSRTSNNSLCGAGTGETTPSTLRAQSSQNLDVAAANPVYYPSSIQSTVCESDSLNLDSFELERSIVIEDFDSGMASMSLNIPATDHFSSTFLHPGAKYEKVLSLDDIGALDLTTTDPEIKISKLKIEKLNLLREVSACQIEMKRMKATEIMLTTELSLSLQNNKRLLAALASYRTAHDAVV